MAVYLREFATQADYEVAQSSLILPNVSLILEDGGVKYTQGSPTPIYEAIDLGLPSGRKWANMNVGASKPEEEGFFFSWGNVEGHCLNGVTDYDFGTSTTDAPYSGSPGAALSGDIAVGDTYDMARANLGGAWRLPTKEDFQELYDNTTCTWTSQNGVAGRLFISKASGNSKSVFFPAAGNYNGSSHGNVGSLGRYWSSSFYSATNAYYLYFRSTGVYPQNEGNRFLGFSVRAVQ